MPPDPPALSPARAAALPRILLAALLGMAAVSAGTLCVSALAWARRDPRAAGSAAGLAAHHTGILVASLALMLLLSRGRPARFGLRLPARFAVAPLVLLSCGIPAAAALLAALLPGEGLTFTAGYSLPQLVTGVWIYASLAEETLTRGLILGFLAPLGRRGLRAGRLFLSAPVLVAAGFFAALHLGLFSLGVDAPTVLQVVILAFALGLVAGHYRERSGSLLPAFLAHTLANATGWAIDRLLH
jgi:membrane protease YdiL (CAAX protease family)